MASTAGIFGVSGPILTPEERAFFRELQPWGFIVFARNVEAPDQLRRLTTDLRESVGRNAPILVDQEGGRVQRLRAPHWREWEPVQALFDRDPAQAEAALGLRYRLIAAELRDVGLDVNCVPLLDLPVEGADPVIGARALGTEPSTVARRGRIVAEACLQGGVLPIIKHVPGHGRADCDTHHALPRVTAPVEQLWATDFAPFQELSDHVLGMTAHIVYEALDEERCATVSRVVIEMIRRDIGFDGLLMTDDISMEALSGPVGQRAYDALQAGCDMILHCNGVMDEMTEIAAQLPVLAGRARARAERAEAARRRPDLFDAAEGWARYSALTAAPPYAEVSNG
ncbi:MAG: beta-N-acetylhexosaminidase [Pseudomonadota bacterium]